MVKRLVYAYYLPLNKSLERLYSLDFLHESGAGVEYWDLSRWHHPDAKGAALERPYVRRFGSFAEFKEAAAAPDICAFVCVFPYAGDTLREYRVLSRQRAPLVYYAVGYQPAPKGLARRPRRIGEFLGNRLARIARLVGLVRPFDLVFAAGRVAGESFTSSKIVPINHPDFDEMQNSPAAAAVVGGRYAVFLDDNLPFHPDLAVLKVMKTLDPERYYSALNSYFEALERRHGVKVVVAAHPKARYENNPFAGRPIFTERTRELVRGCEFTITTISSSISYAVLYRKPILFVTSEDICRDYAVIRLDVFPQLYAQTLGRPCRFLEAPDTDVPPVDERLYASYAERYLISHERPSREVCLETFRSLECSAN